MIDPVKPSPPISGKVELHDLVLRTTDKREDDDAARELLKRNVVLSDQIAALRTELAKLAAFKTFVHGRLDAGGVPADPPGPHRDEGCRVGQRLDWLFADRDTWKAALTDVADGMPAIHRGNEELLAGQREVKVRVQMLVAERDAAIARAARSEASAQSACDDLRQQMATTDAVVKERDALAPDKAKLVQRINNLERGQQTLRGLLTGLVDDDPCQYDHHGLCQTHGLSEKPCVMERARAVLAEARPR